MIAEFYEGCEIFMTGGSGVVGKSAIEKLFRSCNVKKIYILLRCKKGVGVEDRLKDIKNSRIFKVLKELKPNELDKLVAVSGDTAHDGLGISSQDKESMRNVSIVVHSAATTRFDEPLKKAIRLNLKSTLEALKLAEGFSNLKIFIHVSTFFSYPYLKFVEGKVYPGLFDWRMALKMLENDQIDSDVDIITEKVINGFPNTYLFTKHLAEQLVNEYRLKLPVGIYRPSIVTGAIYEPERGFTESQTGFMGLILVWGTGLIQTIKCRRDIQIDLTPLDFGTNVFLVSTARAGRLSREKFEEATPVTMFSSRGYINYSLGEQTAILEAGVAEYPFVKSIWKPDLFMTKSRILYVFLTVALQLLPSMIIDGLLKLFGQKPFMMQVQRKIFITLKVLDFFMNNEYNSDGVTDMAELMAMARGTPFSLDEIPLCCNTYREAYKTISALPYGCRKFLMNEDDSTLEWSRKVLLCKNIVYNLLRGYVLFYVGKAVLRVALTHFGQ